MTSTNISVGLNEGKNSSKVLRPPGGGHTDIFGNGNVSVTPSKRRIPQQSQIANCFSYMDEKNEDKNTKSIEEADDKNGNIESKTEANENSMPKNGIEEKTVPTPKRGKVPPGGYSSILW